MKSKYEGVHGFLSFTFLLGFVLLLLLESQTFSCPTVCQVCTGRQVNCRGLGLTYIPRSFPKTTSLIYLSGNKITHINGSDFNELDKLAVLYLDNSSISYIHPKAFGSLKKLYYLYLNDNFLKLLEPGAFEGLFSLNYLHLQHNQITFLPLGLFGPLTAVRYLTLLRNQICVLESDVFTGMFSLRTLNLAKNNISLISDAAFRDLENLEHLYLEWNCLTQTPSNALGHLKNLKKLSLSSNPLGSIHNFAFKGLDSLQYLFLENANIHVIDEKSFFGLNNLKQLILSKNILSVLESKMFNYLNHLMYLQLDKNSIFTISENTFEEMVSLKVLNLAFNNLTFLQPKVLQPLISLTHFQATHNPWDCSCRMAEIRNFLLSSSFTFSIHCQNPPRLRGRPLRNIKRSELEDCFSTNSLPPPKPVEFSTTVMFYRRMENTVYNPHSEANGISASREFSHDGSIRHDVLETTTSLYLLSGEIPRLLAPVNLTKEVDGLLPADAIVTVSLKPFVVCQQQISSMTQSFHILLSFFICSCIIIIFLIIKVVQLKKRLVPSENQGDNVLEYYSCYQSGRYLPTDPLRITPQGPLPSPEIDIIRPLKQSDNQTQVILFEHSAL
ncbi:hypothetical protein GDO86_002379 [Hymenochirus boettgeri]|uniref:Leucine-rich repeat-containing protein 70 n=1 Tax=Hymenochirus boettgeri TaxID=247094 RepID=A0A8T2KJS9_9PIPI|nr:hypothetical protein GDO86_002379 [Hymenochirus boettgeri]